MQSYVRLEGENLTNGKGLPTRRRGWVPSVAGPARPRPSPSTTRPRAAPPLYGPGEAKFPATGRECFSHRRRGGMGENGALCLAPEPSARPLCRRDAPSIQFLAPMGLGAARRGAPRLSRHRFCAASPEHHRLLRRLPKRAGGLNRRQTSRGGTGDSSS